jgi:hypothetical protein
MNISKSKFMSLIATGIVLAMYNLIVFAAPFAREKAFWIAYGFSMFAILLTAGVSFYGIGRGSMKSRFYRWPLLYVAWFYLAVQIVLGFIFMLIPLIPTSVQIILSGLLLGVCLIGLLAADVGTQEIERVDKAIQEKVFYIKSLQADVESLVARAEAPILKKELKELADTIRYSDPMSSPQLAAIENKIEAKAAELAERAEGGDAEGARALCAELQQLFADRNRKCKLLK